MFRDTPDGQGNTLNIINITQQPTLPEKKPTEVIDVPPQPAS